MTDSDDYYAGQRGDQSNLDAIWTQDYLRGQSDRADHEAADKYMRDMQARAYESSSTTTAPPYDYYTETTNHTVTGTYSGRSYSGGQQILYADTFLGKTFLIFVALAQIMFETILLMMLVVPSGAYLANVLRPYYHNTELSVISVTFLVLSLVILKIGINFVTHKKIIGFFTLVLLSLAVIPLLSTFAVPLNTATTDITLSILKTTKPNLYIQTKKEFQLYTSGCNAKKD